ncbi:MAG: 50S ribosomal protein L17 [Patescibacteria group bacterium]|nr:50S ribosomal protein L17 [Patescibacteria group bacterium]
MVHRVGGKKLNRDTNHRKALLRNLANSLILSEKIETTEAKAKAVRPVVEKLITKAKQDDLHNRRQIAAVLPTEVAIRKMMDLIGPKFKERPGGYTRITKLGPRVGDAAPMVRLEFVENVSAVAEPQKTKEEKPKKSKITVKKISKEVKDKKETKAKKKEKK